VANHPLAAIRKHELHGRDQKCLELCLYRLGNQPARARSQDFGERIIDGPFLSDGRPRRSNYRSLTVTARRSLSDRNLLAKKALRRGALMLARLTDNLSNPCWENRGPRQK